MHNSKSKLARWLSSLAMCCGILNGSAQGLSPIHFNVNLKGQVILDVLPLEPLTVAKRQTQEADSTIIVEWKELKANEGHEHHQGHSSEFQYSNYPLYSAILFTHYNANSPVHFPRLINRSNLSVQGRKTVIKTHHWTGTYGHEKAKPHNLELSYDSQGKLKSIREAFEHENNEVMVFHWKYRYRKGVLRQVKVGEYRTEYQYNQDGKIQNIIHYKGKLPEHSPYCNADSLALLYEKKASTLEIRKKINTNTYEALQWVLYSYKASKLNCIWSYDHQSGIKQTLIEYDSKMRIQSIQENSHLGGFIIQFEYDEQNSRLVLRKERSLSDCYDRGCSETEHIETYDYNNFGFIQKIDAQFTEYTKEGGAKARPGDQRLKLFNYRIEKR